MADVAMPLLQKKDGDTATLRHVAPYGSLIDDGGNVTENMVDF
jgi:hypothetical protein